MMEYAQWLQAQPQQALRELAMGRQMADCLGSPELARWCKQQAERQYHVARLNDPEYARYHLARMDIAELIPIMNAKGHMGWHVAARLAEFAFHQPDLSLLERAVNRLCDFEGVDPNIVDPQLEYVLADVSYNYLLLRAETKGRMTMEQKERLSRAIMRTGPIFRQRAALDLCRMYLGINYGNQTAA